MGCVSGTPEEHLKTGGQAFQRGDTATAIKEFNRAIRLDKAFAPAHYNLGVCYSTSQNRDKAIARFEQAIALDPGYADAYVALAQSYLRKDSMPAAVGILQRGLALGLAPERFYGNLGYSYLLTAQKDSAIRYYKLAAGLNPTRDEYFFNIGYLLSATEQSDSSIKYLRKARELAANPVQVSFLLGCRLLDKPGRTRKETGEGVELLKVYLANGDGDPMKTAKAREKLAAVGEKP